MTMTMTILIWLMLWWWWLTGSSRETNLTACIMRWPDGISQESLMDYVYNIIFLATTYAVPMLGMGVCYTIIGRVLWGENQIGELNQRHVDTLRSKRKVCMIYIDHLNLINFLDEWLSLYLSPSPSLSSNSD